MRTIKKVSDLDYSMQEAIQFEATVLEVMNEGLEENKRPLRVSLKLEESGEVLQAISWSYNLLQLLKDASKSIDIISFEALSGVFSNKQQQIRIGNAQQTGKQSLKKVIRTVDVMSIKREFQSIISKYISTPLIRDMLEQMIMDNSNFFEWPASSKLHHAYEGGLASHTLNVTRNAIALWENYQGENLDIEVVVAGAMLHDYGKLTEYNKDGSRTIYGDLISHLVDGSEKVSEFCWKRGINPTTDRKIVIIKHILLSHHEKPEFGAAVKPATLEAFIVSRADAVDAVYGGVSEQLQNLTSGQMTDRLMVADGAKVLRWK